MLYKQQIFELYYQCLFGTVFYELSPMLEKGITICQVHHRVNFFTTSIWANGLSLASVCLMV